MRQDDGTWAIRPDAPDPRKYAFGFGRRVCPGTHIAEQSLFATIATVLHTLDVFRAKDRNLHDIVPDVRVNSGTLSHPCPFPYRIRQRRDAQMLVMGCASDAYQL